MSDFALLNKPACAESEDVATGVFKHRNGNWGYRANVPGGQGTQVKRVGFPTMLAAYAARSRFLGGQEVSSGSSMTVGEWFSRYLEVVRETRRPTTSSNYKFAFDRMLPHLGEIKLRDLDEEAIRTMYRRMSTAYTTDTLTSTHGRLRSALRAAQRELYITRCPADNVSPPAGRLGRTKSTWTFDQLSQFTAFVSGQRDRAMWISWITIGARRGEICGLRWPKVLLDSGEIVIDWQRIVTAEGTLTEGPTKTKHGTRVVPINQQVVAALREWKSTQSEQRLAAGDHWQGSDYVFTSQAGRPYYPGSFDGRLAKLAQKAHLPLLTPHELRHTFASRCLEIGMDVKLVSAMLGHARVETTMNLYQHVNPAVARREADALARRMLG